MSVLTLKGQQVLKVMEDINAVLHRNGLAAPDIGEDTNLDAFKIILAGMLTLERRAHRAPPEDEFPGEVHRGD